MVIFIGRGVFQVAYQGNLNLNTPDVDMWHDPGSLFVASFRSLRKVPRGSFWLVRVVSVSHLVGYK